MASIAKHAKGWRVQISVKGTRDSAVFSTQAEARAWAAQREAEMRRMVATGINTDKTVGDAFDRYSKEVSTTKRGEAWEQQRLITIGAHEIDGARLDSIKLCEVSADMIGKWRDMRARTVLGSTINRDLALLSNVFQIARKEWKWIAASPTTDVRRPQDPPARDRRISEAEISAVTLALGYTGLVRTKSDRVAVAFLFAIETAMRAGEICALTWGAITGKVAHLPMTKNGTRRDVPLSPRATALLESLPRGEDSDPCFGSTSSQLDAIFRKARDKSPVEDLTFHDSRHEAITRLARKIDVLDLARMTGHRDIKQLMVYYNATAADIAEKL